MPGFVRAAPEERKRLNGIELDGRKDGGSGGARTAMRADLLGECQVDGAGRGGVRVGGARAALCRASSIRNGGGCRASSYGPRGSFA